jgi:hypothetical protein
MRTLLIFILIIFTLVLETILTLCTLTIYLVLTEETGGTLSSKLINKL